MSIHNCQLISLPKVADPRGNLTFIEGGNHVPFDVQRVYWIYDVPGGEGRGGHAYHDNCELIIAVSGSFDVVLDDGRHQTTVTLRRSYYGLLVPNLIWRSLINFSTNSLCLILASQPFSESDYIRDYEQFKKRDS